MIVLEIIHSSAEEFPSFELKCSSNVIRALPKGHFTIFMGFIIVILVERRSANNEKRSIYRISLYISLRTGKTT